MFDKILAGKVALITGGGSGIGQAIAMAFAEAGAQVAVVDLDLQQAESTVEKIRLKGEQATAFSCDVAQQSQVDEVAQAVNSLYGSLDIWVNNAGIAHVGNIEGTTGEDLDRLYQVNVKGVYHGMQAAVKQMRRQGGGAILNLASIASKLGIAERFAYSMTKGAVYTMTLSVAKDYVNQNIRCNCICPARVYTPFVDGYLKNSYPGQEAEVFKTLSEYQPIGRMGKPEEIAQLALFLCSELAAFITGADYDIDGGVTRLR